MPATINSFWLGLDLFHAATLLDYTFNFAFLVTIFMSLKGELVSRIVSKITSERKVEQLKTKKRNYVKSSRLFALCLSLWPCYWRWI